MPYTCNPPTNSKGWKPESCKMTVLQHQTKEGRTPSIKSSHFNVPTFRSLPGKVWSTHLLHHPLLPGRQLGGDQRGPLQELRPRRLPRRGPWQMASLAQPLEGISPAAFWIPSLGPPLKECSVSDKPQLVQEFTYIYIYTYIHICIHINAHIRTSRFVILNHIARALFEHTLYRDYGDVSVVLTQLVIIYKRFTV